MKRTVFVLVLAACVAGGAFAQSIFSIGGGFMTDLGRTSHISGRTPVGRFEASSYAFGVGGFVFLDATFAELSIGFIGGSTETEARGGGFRQTDSGTFTALNFSLLGKIPAAVGGGNIVMFPLLGVGYTHVLSISDDDDEFDASDYSSFRISFGAGFDFGITERVFFRTSFLGDWRFAPSAARDVADELGLDASGGFGFALNIGLGFRL